MAKQTNEKILVYGDVHGNIAALSALMKTKDYKTATKKIFLGDSVTMGDSSRECLEKILADTDVYLLGNHDSYVANGLPNIEQCSVQKISHQAYIRSQIPDELKEILKTKPKEYYLDFCGKKLYFTHYLWKDSKDVQDELEGKDRNIQNLDKKFSKINADIIFHGHDHYPAHFVGDKKEYYIVGSLGMKIPAKYIVITSIDGQINIKHKTLKYNYKKVIKKMKNLGYPGALVYAEYFEN